MTDTTAVQPAIEEGHEALVASLTDSLMEASYQAEAFREYGDHEDAPKAAIFDGIAESLLNALAPLVTPDELSALGRVAVRRGRSRCGLD